MIFTELQVEVSEYISGSGSALLRLVVPGGTVDGARVWIPGLPDFSQGENVLLFLRAGFQSAGDPVVGVNQGVFRVVTDPATGGELLLDANQRLVTGIENDQVVTRSFPGASTASTQRVPGNAGAPVPSSPGIAVSASSNAAAAGPPMPIAAFMNAVNARLRR
jgi:hypothetical protein